MDNKIPKITQIHRPLEKGEIILVPCVVAHEDGISYVTPVYPNHHDDVESGQNYRHYHADYRFIPYDPIDGIAGREHQALAMPKNLGKISENLRMCVKVNDEGHFLNRPTQEDGKLEWLPMEVIDPDGFRVITSRFLINTSCIGKKNCLGNRCPHRGFDLSQVKPKDGIITCPLHGLRFDTNTKSLLDENYKNIL